MLKYVVYLPKSVIKLIPSQIFKTTELTGGLHCMSFPDTDHMDLNVYFFHLLFKGKSPSFQNVNISETENFIFEPSTPAFIWTSNISNCIDVTKLGNGTVFLILTVDFFRLCGAQPWNMQLLGNQSREMIRRFCSFFYLHIHRSVSALLEEGTHSLYGNEEGGIDIKKTQPQPLQRKSNQNPQ